MKRLVWLVLITLFVFGAGCKNSGKQGPTDYLIDPEQRPIDVTEDLVVTIPGKVKVRFKPYAINQNFTIGEKSIGLERLHLRPIEQQRLLDLGLVQVRRVAPQLEIRQGKGFRVVSMAELRAIQGKKPLSDQDSFLGVEREMILVFPPSDDAEKLCEAMKAFSFVQTAETISSQGRLAPLHPNDPEYVNGHQWGLHNAAEDFDIDAPEAWETQKGDPAVVVAVVDDGIDVRHEDLYEKIWINTNELPAQFVSQANALSSDAWPNILTFVDLNAFSANASTQSSMSTLRLTYNLVDRNANGYIDGEDLYNAFADNVDNDPTATAGYVDDIVGWNFNEDYYGPLPMTDAYHGTAVAGLVGATTNNSRGIAGVGWNARIMAVSGDWSWPSIAYAITHGAHIITSSLDPISNPPQLPVLLATLEDEGILFSAALGNVNRYTGGTVYARYPYTIAVSNMTSAKKRPQNDASGFSVNTDVAGPGNGTYSLMTPSGTTTFGGTSGANPIIAGILSLMVSERGDLRPEQYRQVLRASAYDVPAVDGDLGENTPGFDYYTGWGLANARTALDTIHDDPWAEATITTPFTTTYWGYKRKEEFHATQSTIPVKVIAGSPGGGSCAVKLDYAQGTPLVAGTWTTAYSATQAYLNNGQITTLNRSSLASGVNTLRLTVTTGGKDFTDYQRIDVIYAYMNIKDYTHLTADFAIEGIACHPQFSNYKLQWAAGHNASESDPSLWTTIGTPQTTQIDMVPGSYPGWYNNTRILFPSVSIADLPDGPATLRLAVCNSAGTPLATHCVPVTVDNVNFPYQAGFPQALTGVYRNGAPVVYDLNGDGKLELVVSNQSNVYVFQADGTLMPGWPASVGEYVMYNSPSVGDVTGDGIPEIVVRAINYDTSKDILYVFSRSGELVSPWPLSLPTKTYYFDDPTDNAPVLADLDADGDLEIAISGTKSDDADASITSMIYIYQGNGYLWTTIGPGDTKNVTLPPSIADMDNDGVLDIVVITEQLNTYRKMLSIWHADGTQLTSAPTRIFSGSNASSCYFRKSLTVDIDGDGDLEVVIAFLDRLCAYHHNGTPVQGWSEVVLPVSRIASISAGDLLPDDGSSTPQIIVSFYTYFPDETTYRYGLYALGGDGNILPGWDGLLADKDCTFQQPTVFDVDNDGSMEVLIGPNKLSGSGTQGLVYGYNHDGTLITDFNFPILVQGNLVKAPVIADLDRDGDLEYSIAANSNSAPVEVFDLNALDDVGAVAWGMESHDPQRTNNYHGGIRILEPTTTRPTNIGSYASGDTRHMLLVRIRKEIPQSLIEQSSLSVTVGEASATISSIAQVEGELWILTLAPNQAGPGLYNLEVSWNDGNIRRVDRQHNAVSYSEATPPSAQVLVIDRSGSMGQYDKYLAARTAGRFYASACANADLIGIVSFNTAAVQDLSPCLELGPNGSANRTTVVNSINNVPMPSGRTSIGAGLLCALDNVIPQFTDGRTRAMVLVSDGLENTEPFWDIGANPVHNRFDESANRDIVIHTIAIGPDADRELHGEIAAATNGTCRYVYIGNSLSIFSRLADAYKQAEEEITGYQRVYSKGEDIHAQSTSVHTVLIPFGARSAQFAVSYRNPESSVDVLLRNSMGVDITDNTIRIQGPSSCVLTLDNVVSGNYELWVTPLKGATEALVTVSVQSPDELVASLAWIHPVEKTGMSGTVLAAFAQKYSQSQSNLRTNVAMRARVVAPDKSITEITLNDDGQHHDGSQGDGVFGAPVTFDVGGGYIIIVIASITQDTLSYSFERTLGYFQARTADSDLDGMLDSWEKEHFPRLSITSVNPLSDNDGDVLNAYEEFRYRTDPHRYDSDGDGSPDGAEVEANTSPSEANPPLVTQDDTDGDGIPDNWERLNFPGKEPAQVDASADPDEDTLQNFTEWRKGTNPNRSDSDGDGIDDGTENQWRVPVPGIHGSSPQPPAVVHSDWWSCWWLLLILVLTFFVIIVLWKIFRP